MIANKTIQYTAALSVLLLLGCSSAEVATDNGDNHSVAVRTAVVQRGDFPVTLELTGTIKGERQTVVPAKLTSSVISTKFHVGQKVQAGDIVIELDKGGVQSQFHQTEALFRNAEKQLHKMQSLLDAGAISEHEMDLTTTDYEVAKANFDAARQAVEVQSPISGVVTDLYVRAGDEVSPGTQLFEVAKVSALRLTLDVPTAQVSQLRVGQPVTVHTSDQQQQSMNGTVYSIADAADRSTRSFEVECRFENPPRGFAPGTFVTASIDVRTLEDVLLVDADAILYRSGQAYTYAIAADTAALIPVDVLAYQVTQAAVEGNLAPGQHVVVTGQKNLTPGAHVREAD